MQTIARLPWLWDWSPAAWAALATWGTLAVAGAAAGYARHQVREARRTREEQAQPFVVVDFEPSKASPILMDLIIRNTGTTIATNVTVECDPPLESTLSKHDSLYRVQDAAIIRQGIPTMPPGREYRLLFERMPDRYESELPRSYDARVEFDDTRGKHYEMRYRLDLDHYVGFTHLTIYGEHDVAKSLRKIERILDKWTRHMGGLSVWLRDEDAHLARQAEEFE